MKYAIIIVLALFSMQADAKAKPSIREWFACIILKNCIPPPTQCQRNPRDCK